MTKLYEQHQKLFLHSESIKWCYKREEEKDKEFYKHVNNTYKQVENQTLVSGAEARLVRDCLFNHLGQSRPESESGGPSQTRAAAFQPGWSPMVPRAPAASRPADPWIPPELMWPAQNLTAAPRDLPAAFVAILAVRTGRLERDVRTAYSSTRVNQARYDCGPSAGRVKFECESDASRVQIGASRVKIG